MDKNMKETKPKNSNKIVLLGLVAVIALVAIVSGFLYASSRSEKDVLVVPDNKVEEKGAPKTVISLLDESIEAQRQIDNILLTKNNWQLVEEDRVEKLKKVEASAARVRISQRELNVGIPSSSSVRGAAEWLSDRLQGRGIYVVRQEFVRERNYLGYELQVGIKVKAGSGSRLFVTDTITFLYNDNLTVPDKDVKDYPDEEPKPKAKKAEAADRDDDDEIVERNAPEKSLTKVAPRTVAQSSVEDEEEEDDEEEEPLVKSSKEDDEEEESAKSTEDDEEDEEEEE